MAIAARHELARFNAARYLKWTRCSVNYRSTLIVRSESHFISKLETRLNLRRCLQDADGAFAAAASHLQPTNRLSLATNVITRLCRKFMRKRMKVERRKMGKIFSQVFPACKAWICVRGDSASVAGEARSPNWKSLRGTFTFERNAQVREVCPTCVRLAAEASAPTTTT